MTVDFLDTVEHNTTRLVRVNRAAPKLTKNKNILFHLTGYIFHKVIKFACICEKCKIATEHNDDSPAENSMLVNLKELKAGALCHPSQEAYDFITKLRNCLRPRLVPLSWSFPMQWVSLRKKLRHSPAGIRHAVEYKKNN